MAKHKFLTLKVWHSPTGMNVVNAGETAEVPDRLLQTFIDEGAIAGKTSKELQKEAAERAASGAADGEGDGAPVFTATHIAGGVFEITGPGLDQPERVKGKTEAAVRVAELTEAHKAEDQDDDAGDGEGDGAPLFTATHIAGGLFEISGPGLEQPERVKGKTEAAVRVAELTEAHKAEHQDDDAGDGEGDGAGAPPV